MPIVTARGRAEGCEEEAGAGVGAEAEKDGTAETEEQTADVGTGTGVTGLLLQLVLFRRRTTTTAARESEGGITCTFARTHAQRHGIENWTGIGTWIWTGIWTGTGIDRQKDTRPLFLAGTTTTLGRAVIVAVTVSKEGAGVAVAMRGGVRAVVAVGVGAVVGSRSNTRGVVALATAMASAAMVKEEATGGEAWAAAGAAAELASAMTRESSPYRCQRLCALRTSSPSSGTTSPS